MTLISKTQNGRIFKCASCSAIHVEFKNINFNLSQKQFDGFTSYLDGIIPEAYEEKNQNLPYKRKIFIPTGNKAINIILNAEEFRELRSLFSKEVQSSEEDKTINQNENLNNNKQPYDTHIIRFDYIQYFQKI